MTRSCLTATLLLLAGSSAAAQSGSDVQSIDSLMPPYYEVALGPAGRATPSRSIPADLLPPGQAGGDEAAIRELVQRYNAAREANDPKAIEALFVADADQLVSSGEWRRGREALVKGAMASSARTGGTRTLTVEAVRMIAPDVAVADARYEISGQADGSTRRMWSTFVTVRDRLKGGAEAPPAQGVWKISAIRNMLPAPPAGQR